MCYIDKLKPFLSTLELIAFSLDEVPLMQVYSHKIQPLFDFSVYSKPIIFPLVSDIALRKLSKLLDSVIATQLALAYIHNSVATIKVEKAIFPTDWEIF